MIPPFISYVFSRKDFWLLLRFRRHSEKMVFTKNVGTREAQIICMPYTGRKRHMSFCKILSTKKSAQLENLNPFLLRNTIDKKLKIIFSIAASQRKVDR
jgi:hypothetical protein